MKTFQILIVFILFILIFACEKNENYPVKKENLNGYVQKGPFLNGTVILISELNQDLSQNGRIYTSQITRNNGRFVINTLDLTTRYVEFMANGFYYNECLNTNSKAPIIMYAISDLSDKDHLNINVLSHLERNRVIHLVSQGKSLSAAKKQAQKEILAIFDIEDPEIQESEMLDISKEGEQNAILLAVSLILQGYRTEGELSELMANISMDLQEDGILNDSTSGTALINHARLLDLVEIRTYLEEKYADLAMDSYIPDFETYVNNFIDKTNYIFANFIKYPETGLHGINILDPNKKEYSSGSYSMHAVLPYNTILKVKIKGENWDYSVGQDWSGWAKSMWHDSDTSRTFTSIKTGEIDFELNLHPGKTIVYYYENADEPTRLKKITVQ